MEQGKSTSLRLKSKSDKLIPRDISEALGKLPPQAIDLEEAVLGALMLEKNAILDVIDFLKPAHFYNECNKEVYTSIVLLFTNGDPIDMRTVVNKLRETGKLELVGGAFYVANITARVTSAANIAYHSRIIVELAIKRALIELANEIHHDSYEDTSDVFDLLADIGMRLEEIHDGTISNHAEKHVKDLAMENIKEVEAVMAGRPSGILCGFNQIDTITHGFQNGDLIILAARPGMAKSAALAQMLKNMAMDGNPTALFELEMPGAQVVNRLAIGECEIHPDKVKAGKLSQLEFERYVNAQGKLSNLPMWVDDTAGLNIVELVARAIRLHKKHKIKCIGIDYIQLINGRIGNVPMNRDQEIGIITRMLKSLAKKLNIPVIAISSLNRSVETRGGDKRPQLADLRESGNIESDADLVIFLYRPEYYKITVDEDGMPTNGKSEYIFAKHRNGALGTALQKFIGQFTKFTEWYTDTTRDHTQGYKDPTESKARKDDNLFTAPPPFNEDNPF